MRESAVDAEKRMFAAYCKVRDRVVELHGEDSIEATRLIGIAWHNYTMKRWKAGIVTSPQGFIYKDEKK